MQKEKKSIARWRPQKTFDIFKKKVEEESINKWKLWRWRPKKERKIDDSLNTQISSHTKDVSFIEKKNNEIHEKIKNNFSCKRLDTTKKTVINNNNDWDTFSFKILTITIIVVILALITNGIATKIKLRNTNNINNTEKIKVSEMNNSEIVNNDNEQNIIERENIEIKVDNTENYNDDEKLILAFYDEINSKNFSNLNWYVDSYLKSSNTYKTYYSSNWLTNFLWKLNDWKIYVSNFEFIPNDKSASRHYTYDIKYILDWSSNIVQEKWEAAIINRWWKDFIWSLMCITTWCSKMPFFQK